MFMRPARLVILGREVVAACNRLGLMVDISHASDKSFFDALGASRAPIIASHSSCRALCASPRNLSDEQVRTILSRDGIPEPNLVWKDTVLVPTGQTVDLLLDVKYR